MKKEITIEVEALGYRDVPLKHDIVGTKKEALKDLHGALYGLLMFSEDILTYSVKDTGFSLITSDYKDVIEVCKYLIKIKRNKIKIVVSY